MLFEGLNGSYMKWNELNGVLGHDSVLARLYCAGDNLGSWDEFCYASCPSCRIDLSTCWPVAQRATTVPRMPLGPTWEKKCPIYHDAPIAVRRTRFSRLIEHHSIVWRIFFSCGTHVNSQITLPMIIPSLEFILFDLFGALNNTNKSQITRLTMLGPSQRYNIKVYGLW